MSVDWLILQSAISLLLLLIQAPAAFILLSRLLKGPSRRSPVEPHTATPELFGAVSVVVPTLNEAERISPCLAGLTRQSYEVREIIVVDSRSQDGTPDLVKAAQQKDPRFRLINDDPLPSGWVGRPWALHNGFLHMAGLEAGDKGLGAGDWGQGTGGWGLGTMEGRQYLIPNPQYPIPNSQSPIPNSQFPIPNPQSPIPNPQSPIPNPQSPEWFLGLDADTQPSPGLVAGLVKAAEAEGYDLVSLSPQFILKYPGEWWLQPALLMTLLYRFDPAGTNTQDPSRVMANGQCFLCRRSVLEAVGGYTSAKSSFCDDVTLARNIASGGFKVGFLDGAKVLKVRMYEGAAETWNEWGRSLDLKDASSSGQIWGDLWLLTCTQGLPLLASFILLSWLVMGNSSIPVLAVAGLNLFLLLIRFALLLAIAPSYDFMRSPHVAPLNDRVETRNFPFLHLPVYFYLSPLADPLAVLRIFLSAFRTPKQWRGRNYG